MLGKLLKHELQASARMMLPVYAALLVLTFISKFFLVLNPATSTLAVFEGISITLYVLCIIAMFIMTTVVSIYRFYKNLTTDEGYLMFTLPVKPWQLILSKMLISLFWGIVCTVLFILSGMILVLTDVNIFEIVTAFSNGMHEISLSLSQSIWIFVAEVIVLMLMSVIAEILQMYTSIAIGQCFQKNRILFAVLAYIIISIILQVVFSAGMLGFGFAAQSMNFSKFSPGEIESFFHWFFNLTSLAYLILSVVFFVITNEIFKRRLNLE